MVLYTTVQSLATSQDVGLDPDSSRRPIEDMGIEHPGHDVFVVEQFPDCTDVIAVSWGMRRRGVTKGVARGMFHEVSPANRVLHCPLDS